MISVVIPYYQTPEMEWKIPMLKRCVQSYNGHCDELIVLSGTQSTLPKTINHGFSLASGDFIIVSNDDCVLDKGSLRDLAVPGTVTSPLINGQDRGFSGHIFCVPKSVVGLTGGFDENYEIAYFDDDDFKFTVEKCRVPMKTVDTVSVYHPPHGGTTLDKNPNRNEFFEKNKQYFLEKWGRLP